MTGQSGQTCPCGFSGHASRQQRLKGRGEAGVSEEQREQELRVGGAMTEKLRPAKLGKRQLEQGGLGYS